MIVPLILASLLVSTCLCPLGLGEPRLQLQPVVTSLELPLYLGNAGDGSGRLFILEQPGRIRVVRNGVLLPQPFLDISSQITFGGEQGLLGLAFHPDYPQNGRFFLNFTRTVSDQLRTVIAQFEVSGTNPDRADANSEKVILEFDQPFGNHNGGMLAFGPDGLLYVSTGDGGSGGDPLGNAQNLGNLLGKILRIDVDHGNPYSIPDDNPFTDMVGARGEIWAYGLRNPWRFSFDSGSGRVFAGDVGQRSWEEVDLITRGGNYGWNIQEGTHCFAAPPGACDIAGLTPPIAEMERSESRSVTGGYVYRGLQKTSLWGSYIFGDFSTGRIWSLTEQPGGTWKRRELLRTDHRISSFGEDEDGELYLVARGGEVFKLLFSWRELFSHAADGPALGGKFRSRVILVNSGEVETDGTLRFFSGDGSPRAVVVDGTVAHTFPFSLPGGSSHVFATDGGSEPFFVGWAEALADGPVAGTLQFSLEDVTGKPLAEAGVFSSSPSRRLIASVERSASAGVDTGIAIVNPSLTDPVSVEITLREENGPFVLTTTLSFEPGEHQSLFISELGELPTRFLGTALLDASGEIIATLIRTVDGLPSASLPFAD